MRLQRFLIGLLVVAPAGVCAQSLEVVHAFSRDEGYPMAQLSRTADGSFWSTNSRGGRFGKGSIFRLSPDGQGGYSLTEIHSFFGDDGASPQSSLLLASDGRFYGTTRFGGAFGGGTLFRTDTSGNVTTLYSFPQNTSPQGDLVEATDGMLYGSTLGGGDNGLGSIFRSDRSGAVLLHSFSGPDGLLPNAGLTLGPDSHLYGTTLAGGVSNGGVVFRLEDDFTTTTLHEFDNAADGSPSLTSLILGSDGLLYGVTASGGPNGTGTIFRISTAGSFEMLHGLDSTEGSTATAPLFEAAPGVFLGTASFGGDSNEGTAFKFELPGTFTRLYSFSTFTGSAPYSGFIDGGDGLFWTMTTQGGDHGIGEIFRIDIEGASPGIVASFDRPEGTNPEGPLLPAADGNLYGTATQRGSFFAGSIFRIEAGDAFRVVHRLDPVEGMNPGGPLAQGADGAIYGTLPNSGTAGIFRIDPSTEAFSGIRQFDFAGGYSPRGGVFPASDGLLYGSLMAGGANDKGTLFRVDTTGSFTKLWDFTGPEGEEPGSPLLQAADGKFYGTATAGGSAGNGTVFVLDPDTGATLVHAFAGADGSFSQSGLLEVSPGVFYGTCTVGGTDPNGGGTVFEVHSDGSYSVLHQFGSPGDGFGPSAGLIQASDGNFYGTTGAGGPNLYGTIYRMDSQHKLTIVYSFSTPDGASPMTALAEAADGALYGTTDTGGAGDRGTVFRWLLAPPPAPQILEIAPTSGPAAGGLSLTLTGTHFSQFAVATLGGSALSPFGVDSRTILAVSRALTPGTLNDLVITNPDQAQATLAAAFFADFVDVDDAYIFHDFIESIVRAGITAGCGGGNYCPGAPVSRAQMAVFLLKAEHGASYVPPACNGTFADTPCPGPFTNWIEQLAAEGVTGGCGGGNYCPGNPVTRAQMAVFLLKTLLGSSYVPPAASGVFGDVPPGSFAADWIEDLYARQITGGCSTSPLLYCPIGANTRGQMAVFLTKTFSLP